MFISVIIATQNRADLLKNVLRDLRNLERNGSFDYEILVVNNNSTDSTEDMVRRSLESFNGRLRYLFEQRRGKSYALNTAIRAARGEVLAFTDDDVTFDKDWLINLIAVSQKYDADMVGGRVLPVYPVGTPQWVKDNRDVLRGPVVFYDMGEETMQYSANQSGPIAANMAIKKKLFERYGLFRTDLGPGAGTMGDDWELSARLRKNSDVKAFY
jgi:glycosyltransferase involved in cell wall biosynthesis